MQFFDLFTQGNCPFEIEALGCVPHLLLELYDDIGNLVPWHMFCILDLDFFFLDRFFYGLRDDMMLGIVRHLQVPTPFCLGNCPFHGFRHDIGIQDDMCIDIPCRPPDNLDQAPCIAEEPFLVCIKDADEPYLRDVESFPKEVDPDKYIELPETELTDNLAAFERLYLRVEVPVPDALVCEELRQTLLQVSW